MTSQKMIRSLNSREKMSNARSPRGRLLTTSEPMPASVPCHLRLLSAVRGCRKPRDTGADEREPRPHSGQNSAPNGASCLAQGTLETAADRRRYGPGR